jgi:hypothetical protein
MREVTDHLSDEKLLLFADGETEGRENHVIRNHLAACWSCRLRMRELDDAIAEVARMHRQTGHPPLPSAEGPRALLRARLRELAEAGPNAPVRLSFNRSIFTAAALVAIGVLLAVIWMGPNSDERNGIPRSDLTPGAVRSQAAREICGVQLNGNAEVLPVVQRQVFAEYGVPNAEMRAYEVDYLITPALGGSDDIRNLWPQPYTGSPWNAHVKDALEDYLRGMVCSGQLDLATAQHEIAENWISAYKKYFHTRQPLPQHHRP